MKNISKGENSMNALTLTQIIEKSKLDLENKNYFVFVDKITPECSFMQKEYYLEQSDLMHADISFLYKEYRHAFILNKGSNIEELEKKLEERRNWFADKIYLKDLGMRHLRNRDSLVNFLEKVTSIIKTNGEELNDDFLTFGYDFFKDHSDFKLDMAKVMEIVFEINANPNFGKVEKILAFWVLMTAIRAWENKPNEHTYRREYESRVRNVPIEQVENELLSFTLKVKDLRTEKKFLFDGREKIYFQEDIEFRMNDRNEIYIKNTRKIDGESSDFEYFFFENEGFIKMRDEYEEKYKSFDIGREVVRKKVYDSFETVDNFFV
jgi:hypothetical protein